MSWSQRVDPTGKSALFSPTVAAAPDRIAPGPHNEGKSALFSTPPRRPGTVLIECSSCKVRSRATLADLGFRLVTGSAWVPFQRHQHWLMCPSCRTRRWCRIGWTE